MFAVFGVRNDYNLLVLLQKFGFDPTAACCAIKYDLRTWVKINVKLQ